MCLKTLRYAAGALKTGDLNSSYLYDQDGTAATGPLQTSTGSTLWDDFESGTFEDLSIDLTGPEFSALAKVSFFLEFSMI